MQVTFDIEYYTSFGQSVAIVGDYESFGKWNSNGARRMEYAGEGRWKLTFKFPAHVKTFSYHYLLTSGGWSLNESGVNRFLDFDTLKGYSQVYVQDKWRSTESSDVAAHINSSMFTHVAFGRDTTKLPAPQTLQSVKPKPDAVTIHVKIHAIAIPQNYTLRICGDAPTLGKWDPKNAPVLNGKNFPVWEAILQVPRHELPSKYKFVWVSSDSATVVWEDSPNRYLGDISQSVALISTSLAKGLEWKGAGVAIPVFSLRSKTSCGVGEFLDLKLLVDWAAKTGLRLIQILPINDTTVRGDWRDSYPYSALSVFALHPIYLNLKALTKDAAILKDIDTTSEKLNALPEIDYEAVLKYKLSIVHQVFSSSKRESFVSDPAFQQWLQKNDWLPAYSLFTVLKEKFKTSDFAKWGDYSSITSEQITTLTSPKSEFYEKVLFCYYVQYNLHLQLKEAADYALSKHVGIKGDIAIGVNLKCVDTWTNPHLFRLNKQTGAPPDFFSEEGQNWGFPTYNWDEMAKDDYSWWRARLRSMAQYFHAFRIDHILGFFRIWEMPDHAYSGLLGRFYPSIPVWKDELSSKGFWDIKRLTEPYIRRHLLERYFHNHTQHVIDTYLDVIGDHAYKFKQKFNSERAIINELPVTESASVTRETADFNQWLRTGLLRLVQNVLLLQDDEDEHKFYPRIELHKTSSYAELTDSQKDDLFKIYIDYFYHRQEGLWTQTALQRLPVMINSTNMLCCGEDLGMVPKCVEPVMKQLHILGLRVQRMSDDPKKEFQHPGEYDYMTVCTPSVHDTSTLRAWWEEDYPTSQRFYERILGLPGRAPQFCTEFISERIISQHLWAKSMLAVFPIQDLFGLYQPYFANRDPSKERINIPAIAEHYWRYRIHMNLEDIVKDDEFSGKIKHLLQETGRY